MYNDPNAKSQLVYSFVMPCCGLEYSQAVVYTFAPTPEAAEKHVFHAGELLGIWAKERMTKHVCGEEQ